MGINGLTQFLRPIYVKKRVKDLRGSTFGVDAMAWLYRGFYGQKHANNDINERFLSFFYRMLFQLKKYDIKVRLFPKTLTPAKQDSFQVQGLSQISWILGKKGPDLLL